MNIHDLTGRRFGRLTVIQQTGQRWHKGTKTMAEIRSKYGSTTFARSTNSDALPA